MKSLSHASFKSFAAGVAAFTILAATPAFASDCDTICKNYASQSYTQAQAWATQQAQTNCGQTAHSYEEFQSCMSASQPWIAQTAQSAYDTTYSSCRNQCR
jgi:hypothetical protein